MVNEICQQYHLFLIHIGHMLVSSFGAPLTCGGIIPNTGGTARKDCCIFDKETRGWIKVRRQVYRSQLK